MTHDDALPARLSRPCETPLVDLLQAVPTDARMVYEHGPFESQMIPVGRLCHEAQAEIRVLRAQLAAALAARAEPVGDGSMTVEQAIAGVVELFPGADKQALRTLARLLTKADPPALPPGAAQAFAIILGTCADTESRDSEKLTLIARVARKHEDALRAALGQEGETR